MNKTEISCHLSLMGLDNFLIMPPIVPPPFSLSNCRRRHKAEICDIVIFMNYNSHSAEAYGQRLTDCASESLNSQRLCFFSFVFLPETSLSNICIFYSIYVMCYGAVSQIVNLSKKCFYFSRTRRAEIHTTLKQSFLSYAKYLLLVEHIYN